MGTPELIMPLRRGATQVSHSSGPAIESQTPESFLTAPPVSGSSRSQGQILREISGSHVVPVNPACLPSRHHTSIHKSRSPRALHVPDRTTLPPAIHICMGRSEGGDSELWAVLTGLRRPPWTLFPHHHLNSIYTCLLECVVIPNTTATVITRGKSYSFSCSH